MATFGGRVIESVALQDRAKEVNILGQGHYLQLHVENNLHVLNGCVGYRLSAFIGGIIAYLNVYFHVF